MQEKLLLHHTHQAANAAPQVRIPTGNIDRIRSAEIL